MALSAAAIARLESDLATSVEGFITDGLLAWAQAAEGAINDSKDPDEDDSAIYWFISLAGNMLWASTVFFPPAAVVGTVTRATKTASTLGAGLAADTVRKLFTHPPNTASAKAFLRDAVAKQDELENV
jgi:hypothetical protein